MRKYIFSALISLICLSTANAVTFNPSNGTGSITQAEINAAYGGSFNGGIQFTCHKVEHYTATVQYKDTMGNIVTKMVDVPITTYQTVKIKPVAAGYDFVGYGVPNKLNRVPLVGEMWILNPPTVGVFTVSKILSISATPTSTNYGVLGFNGLHGYRKFY